MSASPGGPQPRPPARAVETEDLFFTVGPDWMGRLPRPFQVAGRTVLLLDRLDPRVLVLGYGLGAMGAIMAALRPAARIVGVEPEEDFRRRAAELLPPNVELVGARAEDYLRRARRRFDLVLDDCFELRGGEARRPRELLGSASLLRRRLRPGGIVVRNVLPSADPPDRWIEDLRSEFRHLRLRRFLAWQNVLVAASDRPIADRAWRRLVPPRR